MKRQKLTRTQWNNLLKAIPLGFSLIVVGSCVVVVISFWVYVSSWIGITVLLAVFLYVASIYFRSAKG